MIKVKKKLSTFNLTKFSIHKCAYITCLKKHIDSILNNHLLSLNKFFYNIPESVTIVVVEVTGIVSNRNSNIVDMYTVRFFDVDMFYVQFVIVFNYIKNVFMVR